MAPPPPRRIVVTGIFSSREESEGVGEREGDAFHHGADEVSAGVRGGDAGEGGAGVRVEVRRAFAEEVGRPEQTVCAGRRGGGVER